MPTYLDRIIAAHRAAAKSDTRDLDRLIEQARSCEPARGFGAALRSQGSRLAVIAEVKRASPSKGELAVDLDPAVKAAEYARGGAAAISVLTDRDFFSGSPQDLKAAREAVGVPVLRKDFTVSPADVADARLMGADCVLLIVAALSDRELTEFVGLAGSVGLDALVEVHDEDEVERALAAGATIIGVNQRDLVTFEVDTARAERVAKVIPESAVRVAESGIRSAEDAARLAAAGYDAILVGESVVTSSDPASSVERLRAPK